MTIYIDINTVWAVLGVAGIVVGAIVEIVKTSTPRSWWYDLDQRVTRLEIENEARPKGKGR